MDEARKGRLISEGDTATLIFKRTLAHAPEQVWEAITTPAGLREWLMCTAAQIDGRVGGDIELVSGPGRYHSRGKILAWDPPRLFEYEWNVAPVTEMPLGENAIFRYELAPQAGGSLLIVTYRRITQRTATGFLPGLHVLLDRLEAQLESAALPDWMERFQQLLGEYPAWTQHATSTNQ